MTQYKCIKNLNIAIRNLIGTVSSRQREYSACTERQNFMLAFEGTKLLQPSLLLDVKPWFHVKIKLF